VQHCSDVQINNTVATGANNNSKEGNRVWDGSHASNWQKKGNSMKIMKYSMAICFCIGLVSAQADLISYDLSKLDNYADTNQFDTTRTYPDVTTSGFVVMDPSDNVGRMDRMSVFSFDASSYKVQAQSGSLNLKSANLGFTGSEVLSKTLYPSSISCQWNNSAGTVFYIPADTVMWIGREIASALNNDTVFNDIAYGFKRTNNGAAGRDAGDIIELVGIVYSTGTDSVFGKTADELTTIATKNKKPSLSLIFCGGCLMLPTADDLSGTLSAALKNWAFEEAGAYEKVKQPIVAEMLRTEAATLPNNKNDDPLGQYHELKQEKKGV
jgi:hypothetical protein